MATPKFIKREAAFHGPIHSEDWNSTVDELEYDLNWLYDNIQSIKQEQTRIKFNESLRDLTMRSMTERVVKAEDEQRRLASLNGDSVYELRDFRTTDKLFFEHDDGVTWSISDDNRLRIDIGYGQVTLPYDRVVSRFYTVNPDVRKVVPVEEVSADITAVSEDDALKVVNGEISNAFNGQNNEAWVREVWYPLHSDVEEVVVDVDITIPVALTSRSNVLQIHPYPDGLVDIIEIDYDTSNIDPTLDLTDEATTKWNGPSLPANESTWLRGHFTPLAVQRLKLRLRQRNFVERNGFKVFVYGLQEVGLLLVDFDDDDTNLTASDPKQDKAVVMRFDSPDGFYFDEITGIWTDPDAGDDLVLALYSDFALSDKRWDSNSPFPQSENAISLPAQTSSVYLAVGMGYDQANDVAPILKSITMRYITEAE